MVRHAVCATLISATLSGCFLWTSRGDGNRLEQENEDQERRLDALEQRLPAKISELESVLERATKVVTRNSADLGAEVEDLRRQLGELDGQIAELRNLSEQTRQEVAQQRAALEGRINAFAQKAGADAQVDASEIPQDKTEHFGAAYRAYQAGDHPKARALFREYVRRYPQDDQADNAQYWIGASHMVERRPATALGEYRKVISDYPQGDAVDETLYDMGNAFYELHACTDARAALEALVRSHARSPLAARGRTKLREIQRAPRGYCTS